MEMNDAQLNRYMAWSASCRSQYQIGDLTISFNPATIRSTRSPRWQACVRPGLTALPLLTTTVSNYRASAQRTSDGTIDANDCGTPQFVNAEGSRQVDIASITVEDPEGVE